MSNKVDVRRSDREAIKRYNMGLQLGASTDITESPSYGYGELDTNGFWEFPLYFEDDDNPHTGSIGG
jgi:hypothetical protein